jgi:hypothetical protein
MLHCRFDSPTIAIRENGTLRDEAKPLVCCANGFAVGTEDGAIVYREACKLGCEGIVSKRLGSPYRSRGRNDVAKKAHEMELRFPPGTGSLDEVPPNTTLSTLGLLCLSFGGARIIA